MTLNGVESLILRYFGNLIALQVGCITVVEDRPIMFATYCLPVNCVILAYLSPAIIVINNQGFYGQGKSGNFE